MSKGTLEEEDKLTQEDVQKKSKIIIIIKNNNNNKNIRENRNISLKNITNKNNSQILDDSDFIVEFFLIYF